MDEDKESGPAWSIRLRYSDGHEQYVECPDSGLPDKVYLLYHELRGYFKSEEAGELDFVELAYGCSDLTELERLVTSLLTKAEESGNDSRIAPAMMDLCMLPEDGDAPQCHGQRPYRTYSGGGVCAEFLRGFLTQSMTGASQTVRKGPEGFQESVDYVRENITSPGGELFRNSDLDRTLAALEKRYGLISCLSRSGTLKILRLPSSHRIYNSICKIRTAWVSEKEEWYFSIVDVVGVLTEQPTQRGARNYWAKLKQRLKEGGADQLLTNCQQLFPNRSSQRVLRKAAKWPNAVATSQVVPGKIDPVVKPILSDFHGVRLVGLYLTDRAASAVLDEQRIQDGNIDPVLVQSRCHRLMVAPGGLHDHPCILTPSAMMA